MKLKQLYLFVFLFVYLIGIANSQINTGQTLDKIVAVVGNEIIMKSEIDGRIVMLAQSDRTISLEDKEVRSALLNQLIDEKLLITKAREDSIEVTDAEIKSRWEHFLQTSIQRYGSRQRLEQIYGMSIGKLEEELKSEIRNQILAQKLVEKQFGNLQISRSEVETFYKKNKDSLSIIPKSVEIYHIVKLVTPEQDMSKLTRDYALKVRDSLLRGADFAEMAKRHSADGVTAKDGGDLGWFERGRLIPEFEKAAFALQVGDISLPVNTPYGFHIIQVLGKRENSINTRHILFKIEQSTEAAEKAKEFLLNLKKQVEEGADFEELARKHSDDQDSKGFGGFLGRLALNELPDGVDTIVNALEDGDVSEPLTYGTNPLEPGFHIIYRKKTIPEHIPNLDEDYDTIMNFAKNYKKMNLLENWIKELRQNMYWEISEE